MQRLSVNEAVLPPGRAEHVTLDICDSIVFLQWFTA